MSTQGLQSYLQSDINLKDLFDIIDPKNNILLADEVMLADANGTILWVSENYENNFGFAHGSMIGKSCYDLEREGVFNPCVTSEILKTKKKVSITQTINNDYKNVMTVGIPLFDNKGELKYAVCFNTVSLEQINSINRKYNELQESLSKATREVEELRAKTTETSLILRSKPMQDIWTLMQNVANTNANILITGETGVGKSVIAKAIHAMSQKKNAPFIEVNCAVLNENLIESELFGYEAGAFTGASREGKVGKIELANHGTLFLDEIGELTPDVQSKLLELIQNKTIERVSGTKKISLDIRLIVATNKELEREVKAGRFRADLFYRLNVIRLHIPPLRERKEDIVPMAHQFLSKYCSKYDKQKTLSPRFLNYLEAYEWPGNVRELENMMERLVLTSRDPIIDIDILDFVQPGLSHIAGGNPAGKNTITGATLDERVEAFEGGIIREAYARLKSTVRVSKELGISQPTAQRKIAKYVEGYEGKN